MITKLHLVKWALLAILSLLLYLQIPVLATFLTVILSIISIFYIIIISIPAKYKRFIDYQVTFLKNRNKSYAVSILTTDWIAYAIVFFGVFMSGSLYLLLAFLIYLGIVEVIIRPELRERL